jgi:sigma-B regulation protein RsbU (phosphoserine phosphatase)
VDLTEPAQVLTALNAMFPMDDHAGMYFSLWYGVYDQASRELVFASAGHHPAFLIPAEREQAIALRTRNGLIGADPATGFRTDKVAVPPGASLYLFSDGVFEIVTKEGIEWGLSDFLPLLPEPPLAGMGECQRLYRAVRGLAQSGTLDDDFTLLVLTFD